MVFSSLTFIFFFIPVTAIAYFISPSRVWRNGVLLAASLVFYSWGEPRFLALMLLTAGVAWAGGLVIDRTRSKAAFVLTVVLIVSGLFVFKYLNFAADNIGRLFGTGLAVPKMVLPLGISFYTFQILSYVIDLWRGKVKVQKNYLRLLLYVSFFPQLIAGPIVRYSDIEQEIGVRYENAEEISGGIKRFIAGLAKKVIIANGVAKIAELVYAGGPESFGRLGCWLAALAYTLQIYFDFSGYSDMAIGLGRIFGFHFPENFDHPYISTSVTEFWRRWHI
ncbi:MAG: MBOAT family protein, partial [Firmicutes bacterium]|nr:MBOAT family protein [Bacillota bacterium]